MSHHPGSESDQKDPTKSINEATLLSAGGTVEAPNSVINVTAVTYDKAQIIGPQTSTKHVEANTIEHATITHVHNHHHYGGSDKSEESTTGARPKRTAEKARVLSPALPRKKKKEPSSTSRSSRTRFKRKAKREPSTSRSTGARLKHEAKNDGMINKENDSSSSSVDEDDIYSDEGQEKSSSEDSSSSEQNESIAEETPSGRTGARPKRRVKKGRSRSGCRTPKARGLEMSEIEEGFVQITDDIFMNTNRPLKEKSKIYEGYQEHITGQKIPLAIKVIAPYTKKCIREVRNLVSLESHPNVVRIIRSKKHKARLPELYIAMELCGSKTLQDYLNENNEKKSPVDLKKAMSYSKRLLKGMKHIHRHRVIHGDLKPENILLSFEEDQIKVSGFGISKQLAEAKFETKQTNQGADGYRAPETYNSRIISKMSDIYSLGIILYTIFTNGNHPFGENADLWNNNIKKNEGRNLSGLPEEMGHKKDDFLNLLDKMLEFDPEKRPTIGEISEHPFFSSSRATTAQDYEMEKEKNFSDSSRKKERELSSDEQEISSVYEKYSLDDTNEGSASFSTENSADDCVQLSDSIWMFRNRRISPHAQIYEGELRSGILGTSPIVLKLVENIPQSITEARILAKLNNHSHVLSLIRADTFNCGLFDQAYLVLDKCHHENLREFVMNRKSQRFAFNLSLAIEIAEQMVNGVKYIHKNRIIHKDIKPDNILFSLDQKLIKIADFGISQEIDLSSTEVFEKAQFGTNGFRSPESFGRGFISQKSDIFSLGVTIYFVLSNGEHPFGEDPDGWNHHIQNDIIDLSGLLVPNIKTTEHLIKSMIEHKINNRPTIWQVSEHPFWTWNEVSCDFDSEMEKEKNFSDCSGKKSAQELSSDQQEILSVSEKYFSNDESEGSSSSSTENSADDCVQLSNSIWMFRNRRISPHFQLYKGELRSGILDTRPIVLKLVENIPQSITEARILAKLNNHSHVLSQIHSDTFNCGIFDRIYIALEKCHHENLREFVTNRKEQGFAFNLSRAIEIIEQMVDGIKYIHKNRIIHKDIKPDNILFSLNQKLIKIADFGVSQEIDSTSTEVFENRQFGTDGFRPPESFGRGIISQKSDVFSLGVTCYFVLSDGDHPFGKDPDSWNYRVKNAKIDLSGLLVPNIKTTEHLIKSMIEHKINDRPTVWQVSEHPFWTGNEVSCDFDYHCPESSESLIPQTSEKPSYDINHLFDILEHVKKIQLRDEAAAAKIRQRVEDNHEEPTTSGTKSNLTAQGAKVQDKLSAEKAAAFHRGDGGNFYFLNPVINITSGNYDSRKSITALKVADNGSTFTTTEDGTRNTLTVQTPSGNTSAEGSPSTSGTTRGRRKRRAKKESTSLLALPRKED